MFSCLKQLTMMIRLNFLTGMFKHWSPCLLITLLYVLTIQEAFCQEEKSIEEEKYGVKFASDCEGES